MANLVKKECQWRHTVKTEEDIGNDVFITMLLFLEVLCKVSKSVGNVYNFMIFGGFIRRLVYELYAVRDQNAEPGDKDLKEGTKHGGKGDIDIYGSVRDFDMALDIQVEPYLKLSTLFRVTKKKHRGYGSSPVTKYTFEYTDLRTKLITKFTVDVVNRVAEQRPECFNVNALVYQLKNTQHLLDLFRGSHHKSNEHAFKFLNNVFLTISFSNKRYGYHCDTEARHSIIECIRNRVAIAGINIETKYQILSKAYEEIEIYLERGKKLKLEGWEIPNVNITDTRNILFPPDGEIMLTRAIQHNETLFQWHAIQKPFQGLPSYLKDIILSYKMCEHCQYNKKNWCEYSSDDDY